MTRRYSLVPLATEVDTAALVLHLLFPGRRLMARRWGIICLSLPRGAV